MGENKQVRVDNWGIFFLQRLQMFFSKTDYCDLTLQFEGNVQLKVHRLVMNACTEYFETLENTNHIVEENVILMPNQLQADVIVPIVNFMYTGMLEFPMSIFNKLYEAADIMHITVLTKLLDAQRAPIRHQSTPSQKERKKIQKPTPNLNVKKVVNKNIKAELPPTLPGRKLPVWKRKTIPQSHGVSTLTHPEPQWKRMSDLFTISDTAGKPTRFEWPDDDLPQIDMMDSGFGDISYNSKPLLTREEEVRASTSFENRFVPNNNDSNIESSTVDMEEVRNQNICTDNDGYEDESMDDGENVDKGEKRKLNDDVDQTFLKKIKLSEDDKEATISFVSSGNSANIDPTKLVSEILKKYPHLVKKKKSIKLKIVTKSKESLKPVSLESPKLVPLPPIQSIKRPTSVNQKSKKSKEGPWICTECTENNGKPLEFVLYYLFRKHMTDIHNEKFDPKVCKYCGSHFSKNEFLLFHLYTKHGIKPPGKYIFPSCNMCPFIATSKSSLRIHKTKHSEHEMQCVECKLGFVSHEAISSHVQITGHMGKNKRNTFDCQYCMKNSQSANNLLSHIKQDHEVEGRRDGIVSLDDIDEDDLQEEEREEYIVPDIIPDTILKDKVKIISDVKVSPTKDGNRNLTSLEGSSESETLTNVTSGIATSLGLVDIVVLDENQQYILHNQGENSDHSEFIVPEIPGNIQNVSEVISGQTMIPANQLPTTDELVMVLTDHDYQDGQDEISEDNSNIVVLYSHPVDGQQGQFITSQGNLMVNSETGLFEIRNGATITTTSESQIVVTNPRDTHIETIEMIQREIDSHKELKQEPYYEEDRKPEVQNFTGITVENPNTSTEEETVHDESQITDGSIESTELQEQDQIVNQIEHEEVNQEIQAETGDASEVDGANVSENIEESMEIEDSDVVDENVCEQETEENECEQEMDENVCEQETEENVCEQEMEENVCEQETEENVCEQETEENVCQQETEEDLDNQQPEQNVCDQETLDNANEQDKKLAISEENDYCEEEEEEPTLNNTNENDINSQDIPPTEKFTEVQRDEEDTAVVTDDSQVDMDVTVHNPSCLGYIDNKSLDDVPPEDIKYAVSHSATTETMEVDGAVDLEESNSEQNELNSEKEVLSKGEDTIGAVHVEESVEVSPEEKPEDLSQSSGYSANQNDNAVNEQEIPCEQPENDKTVDQSAEELIATEYNQHGVSRCESQYNDENSHSSHESQQVQVDEVSNEETADKGATQISILDDWDDTDSQQSDGKVKAKAKETVHKLIDDWEEEEDEEGKKEKSNV